ncbi:MAG: glycosyltransferase [Verrucomicrobiota bacterium]
MNKKRLKVIFFFRSDRRERQGAPGYPEDLLYGYSQVGEFHDVEILEQNDFSEWKPQHVGQKLLCWLAWNVFSIKLDHVYRYTQRENVEALNAGDVIIVTTVTQGITLALLKHWKKVSAEIVFCATAVANHTGNPLFWSLMKKVCPDSLVSSLSQGEITELKRRLGLPVSFYVFGTDHRFWCPATSAGGESQGVDYVLAVGNDAKRDYQLLVSAWKPEYPLLKIVTGSPLPDLLPPNVERVTSNWHMGDSAQHETEAERLRGLYRGARFIVTPLQETFQPSGQSVALQTLACGKALIIGNIAGIWDREVMRHGENCLFYDPGKVESLQEQVELLLQHSDICPELGTKGRATVEEHYTLEHTAESVLKILERIETRDGVRS